MKRALPVIAALAMIGFVVGCEESVLNGMPSDVQAMVAKAGLNMLPVQIQDRDRLQDGSCDGDGMQYQWNGGTGDGGGAGGAGGSGGGSGDGDQDRNRDGSCGD